jgi:hypothetical protein
MRDPGGWGSRGDATGAPWEGSGSSYYPMVIVDRYSVWIYYLENR